MDTSISKTESYQYPAAHFGHLTDSQQVALDKFKEICQGQGYYFPAGHDRRQHASHDDETLLRYLRARKFIPEEGFQQFKETEEWRKENHLEEYYNKIDIHEYDAARRLYPQWTGRRDKRGIPVYVFEVAYLNSKHIAAYQSSLVDDKSPPLNPNSTVPPRMMRLFALYENLTRFILPLCSAVKDRPHPETPVSQSNNIVDISGVGLRQFWNLKTHMQDASTLATAHYPETLDRIFIIGAPSFFPTVWSWIKRWFDPITVSKIFILSDRDMKATLQKYIAPENIPRKYGGTLDYKFGMMPILEPTISNSLEWTTGESKDPVKVITEKAARLLANGKASTTTDSNEKSFPIGPIKWHLREDGKLEAIAVGSDQGKQRHNVVACIRSEWSSVHGISRTNTAIDWSLEKVQSTSGTETQPPEGDPDYGKDFESTGTSTPQVISNDTNTTAIASAPTTVAMNTISAEKAATKDTPDEALAFDESKSPTAREPLPPSQAQPRTGTSASAYAAQTGTHAEGTMAEDTPHVVDFGHGDKAAVMEPTTVGQARKDAQVPRDVLEGPGVIEQVQSAVTSVSAVAGGAASSVSGGVSSVLAAVGLGGGKKEEKDEKEEKPKGPPLPVKDEVMEGFIREQYPSKAPDLPPHAQAGK